MQIIGIKNCTSSAFYCINNIDAYCEKKITYEDLVTDDQLWNSFIQLKILKLGRGISDRVNGIAI
jgi:hypothetical protein